MTFGASFDHFEAMNPTPLMGPACPKSVQADALQDGAGWDPQRSSYQGLHPLDWLGHVCNAQFDHGEHHGPSIFCAGLVFVNGSSLKTSQRLLFSGLEKR